MQQTTKVTENSLVTNIVYDRMMRNSSHYINIQIDHSYAKDI